MQPPRALTSAIHEAAEEFRVPATLLLAWSWEATEWTVDSWRYEPNVDRFDVSGKWETWQSHPDWLADGPTCAEFFEYNPARADERLTGDYGFVAQTRIAAGYGPFLLRYPVALKHGFTDDPDALRTMDGVRWAAAVLRAGMADGESVGRRGDEALAFGLMCVGGRIPSRSKVFAVEAAHRSLFGRGYWEA